MKKWKSAPPGADAIGALTQAAGGAVRIQDFIRSRQTKRAGAPELGWAVTGCVSRGEAPEESVISSAIESLPGSAEEKEALFLRYIEGWRGLGIAVVALDALPTKNVERDSLSDAFKKASREVVEYEKRIPALKAEALKSRGQCANLDRERSAQIDAIGETLKMIPPEHGARGRVLWKSFQAALSDRWTARSGVQLAKYDAGRVPKEKNFKRRLVEAEAELVKAESALDTARLALRKFCETGGGS